MTRLQKTCVLVAGVLVLFSLARVYLLLANPEAFHGLTSSNILWAFAKGLRFDMAAACTVLGLPLIMMNLPLRFAAGRTWFNAWAWVACILASLMALTLVADVNFFMHLGRHISNDFAAIQQDTNTQEVGRHIGATLIAVFSLVSLIGFWWWLARRPLQDTGRRPLVFLLILVVVFAAARGHLSRGRPMGVIDAFAAGDTTRGNLALNGVYTAYQGFWSSRRGIERNIPENVAYARVREVLPNGPDGYPFTQSLQPLALAQNVVIVVLESWSADLIDSVSGGDSGLTPNFDELAAHGLLFRRFYATHENSIRSLQAALTGFPRLPGMPRVGSGQDSMSRMTRFGSAAQERGYQTLFVQPSDPHAWRYDSVAAALGFDNYFSGDDIPLRRQYPNPDQSETGWDYEIFMFGLDKIDALGEPFAGVLISGTTHKPFADPGPPFNQGEPQEPNTIEAYLATLRYSDWALGQFMQEAATRPWFDDTVFLFFADHAVHRLPGMGMHGGNMLSRYHIPMLIYAPGKIDPAVSDMVASQLDILPTLMDVLGFDADFAAMGQSLLRPRAGWAFVSDATGTSGVGLIAPDGFVRHNLRQRAETGGGADSQRFDELESTLLSLDAAAFHAIRNNRWLRPRDTAAGG